MPGYDSYVKALLHLNVDLTDLSGKSWTANGGAAVSATDPKFGAKCLYLDGVNDYIDTPDHADFSMGSGDFTIDYWLKRSRAQTHEMVGPAQTNNTGSNATCSFTIYLMAVDIATKTLLHFDGTNNSTTITDIGPQWTPRVWTARNHAKLSTTSPKFGSAALLLDGTDDYVDTPDSVDFTMGSGNFTVDGWIKRGATGTRQDLCGQMNSTGTNSTISFYILFNAGNTITGAVVSGNTYYQATSTGTITDTTTWHHIALVRNGNTLTLYIDGVADGSANVTGVTINDSSNNMSIGRLGEETSNYFNGGVDEFRITKGTALWTANFTVPSAALVYDRVQFAVCSGATGYGGPSSVGISDTNWHHVAMVRSGNNLLGFIDGILVATYDVTGVSINDSANNVAFGREGEWASNYFQGYVDEPRISKGIARWTTNFTPPTEEYDDVTQVDLGLLSGTKSLFSLSLNTDQVLIQNLVSKAGSLFSPSFVLDQILTQNLQIGYKTVFSASNVTDQILSQNLLTSITEVFSVLLSTDQILSVNVIPGSGSPYDVTVEITAGAISTTVNLGLLLGIYSVLSASVQTDQILGQSIISKSGSVLGTSEQTDQVLTQNSLSILATLYQLLTEITNLTGLPNNALFGFPKEFLDIDRHDGLTKDIVISFREGDFDQNIKDRNDSSSSVA